MKRKEFLSPDYILTIVLLLLFLLISVSISSPKPNPNKSGYKNPNEKGVIRSSLGQSALEFSISQEKTQYKEGSERSERDEKAEEKEDFIELNSHCSVDVSLERVTCNGVNFPEDLPTWRDYFGNIQEATFVNISYFYKSTTTTNKFSSNADFPTDLHLLTDLFAIFPKLISLTITQSGNTVSNRIGGGGSGGVFKFLKEISEANSQMQMFTWGSIRELNLSSNKLSSADLFLLPNIELIKIFPNLEILDLSKNNISLFYKNNWTGVKTIDISDNPLDCTDPDFIWIERPGLNLLSEKNTRCNVPSYQNKPKPFYDTLSLIKKLRKECRVNCTCSIDYIFQAGDSIFAKNLVNCSNRNFYDFPNPDELPTPTDILYLQNNKISSLDKFVKKYSDLNVMNLYLDNNEISSINILEGSDWFYSFQALSLRNNKLTELPVYLLENVIRQNKWISFIDLSKNPYKCDCRVVNSFKVWLLKYSTNVKNIRDVRCEETNEEIRYLKSKDWCKIEKNESFMEFFDYLSVVMALLILGIIAKVYYDYWSYKRNGKIPWLATKM